MKEKLIQQFKDWCNDPKNRPAKGHAAQWQMQRNQWTTEMEDKMIKIVAIDPTYFMQVQKAYNFKIERFAITKNEYEELKLLYWKDVEHCVQAYIVNSKHSQ